jgi:DNA repair exonuclease SbcCD ATPase subunit
MQKAEVEVVAKTGKAQKAINELSNSLEQLSETGDRNREGFEVLDQLTGGYAGKVKDLAGSISGAIKGAKGFAKSLKGVRGALLATGVGAIVVALGLIVAYWEDIKGLVNGVSREQQESLDIQKESVAQAEQQSAITSQMENTLKLQGKTEKEIRDLKIQQTNETIAALEAQLEQEKQIKASQVAAAERNKSIMMGFITLISAPIVAALSLIDAASAGLKSLGIIEEKTNLAEGFVTGIAEMVFDPEEVAEEGDAAIEKTEEQLRKLKNKRDGFILQDKKEREAKQKEADQKEIDEAKKKAEALEKIRQGEIDTEAERRAEERRKIQEHYTELIRLADLYGEDTAALKEAQRTKEQELQDKFDEEDKAKLLKKQEEKVAQLELENEFDTMTFDEQREVLKQRRDAIKGDELLSTEQKNELLKQYSDASVAITDAEFEAKQTAMMGYASALSDVSGIIGKETAAGKAMAVAASLISTYSSIAGQLQAFSKVPVPGYAIAQAIATGAVGLANVKKIISTKVPKSSGGGGASVPSVGGAAATPQAPSFNIVGATETSQLAEAVGSQTQQPIQAYVVANDVTTAQSLENNIVEGATL